MNRLKDEIKASAVSELRVNGDGFGTRRYRFPPEFVGFSGHFPGFPILPAIVQVLCGLMVAEEIKKRPIEPVTLEKAKFHLKLKPEQEIEVRCHEKFVRGTEGFDIRIETDEGLASSFFVTYAPGGEK
jgi:3-hydroxyacyl-[acyl-carrier-protein] dehydratase